MPKHKKISGFLIFNFAINKIEYMNHSKVLYNRTILCVHIYGIIIMSTCTCTGKESIYNPCTAIPSEHNCFCMTNTKYCDAIEPNHYCICDSQQNSWCRSTTVHICICKKNMKVRCRATSHRCLCTKQNKRNQHCLNNHVYPKNACI